MKFRCIQTSDPVPQGLSKILQIEIFISEENFDCKYAKKRFVSLLARANIFHS